MCGAGDGIRTHDVLLGKQAETIRMLNKLSVSEVAKLSKLSKSYISQVKHGKRPPSQKLIYALHKDIKGKSSSYVQLFLVSCEARNVSENTFRLYRYILGRLISQITIENTNRQNLEQYLLNIPSKGISLGNRHAHFRVIQTFFRWLERNYDVACPMNELQPPKLPKLILPSLTGDQVSELIRKCPNVRDKAIIALAVESGLRISELANIRLDDINWQSRVIKTLGKGNKEAYAPFGIKSEHYLKVWLSIHQPNSNIWSIDTRGIQSMLRRLQERTGLPCNPHTFRRTFACLLRKAGLDCLTIKDLGRWESVEMVQRYTRSITFRDSLKFYKAPLS